MKKAGESFAFVTTVNSETGIESKKESEFAQEKWGPATKSYLINIADKLVDHPTKFDELVTKAKQWADHESRVDLGPSLAARSEPMDERACLMDDLDSD
jgi:hypothetical protein